MYTYIDFVTRKIRRTRGRFSGWTPPTGLLHVRYAIFKNPHGEVLVPGYLLTKETAERLHEIDAGPQRHDAGLGC